jgi:hypothetical protein
VATVCWEPPSTAPGATTTSSIPTLRRTTSD